MPPYDYHLKLELYATPDPTAPAPGKPASRSSSNSNSNSKAATPGHDNIWIPAPGTSIFDDLPSHPRPQPRSRQQHQPAHPIPPRWRQWDLGLDTTDTDNANSGSAHTSSGGSGGSNHRTAAYITSTAAAPVNSRVIDCGARRGGGGPTENAGPLFRDRYDEAAPRAEDGIGPRTAVRDWRFGRVRVESFDLVAGGGGGGGAEGNGDTAATGMAGNNKQVGVVGEAAATATATATPAASLGPNLGGMGLSTKARYAPLETKNTEVGWGVVHLYREGDEPGVIGGDQETHYGPVEGDSKGQDSAGGDEEGTILCIPAVPSYMSPSDFLGFIGEKWRGYVSHYRMIMTGRVNRYMVLMKFRDSWKAQEWRKEFDGKPFDSVEVSCLLHFSTRRGWFTDCETD